MLICLLALGGWGAAAQNSPPAATAEAIIEANLRASTSVESALMGQIRAGTRYPVIGRSEFYPWLLLADPLTMQPIGWVFAELVTVQGDLNSVPFVTTDLSAAAPAVTPASAAPPEGQSAPTATLAAAPPSPTPPPPTGSVIGRVLGEINIRYGPGTEYPRIGIARAGEQFAITRWHTQFPWVEIDYPASPTGTGWVLVELLEISGDLYSLPSTSQVTYNLPTLTPTPPIAQQAALLGTPVPLSPQFAALGDQIWSMMLEAGFDPQTSRLGGLFLMDLRTGEAVAYGEDIAFSGMSVNKIAILAEYFRRLNAPPSDAAAYTIAEAMVCSENISTNELLAEIGDGNPYTGAERVSEFLQAVGLERTFIYTPYANDPFITPQAPLSRSTSADQLSAQPDPYNQITVSETGALLYSLYECAVNAGGPLIERLPGAFTQTECQQMIEVMTHNRIGALIEVGVPEGVRVAHKHGWIDDTHGDAALVFSPGGDYIMVMVLHNPVWLNFDESSALIEEASRLVYNYFNPDAPLAEVRADDSVGDLAACHASLLTSPLIDHLTRPNWGT